MNPASPHGSHRWLPSRLAWCALATMGAGCGASAHPPEPDAGPAPCIDPDDDGHGDGPGCLGLDCAPADPAVHECDCGPDGHAEREGCPCDAPQPILCFEGAVDVQGIGTCAPGLRSCGDGRWGPCAGQVLPREETCDGRDEDCDGLADDGVTFACGDCDADCSVIAWGPADQPFDLADGRVIALTPEGFLTTGDQVGIDRYAWIPNSLEGTISKIDTATYEEVARYRTGPLGASMGLWSGNGDNPSRTAIGIEGDAFVANRAFTGIASVTRILATNCPEGADGRLRTSSGGGDVLPWGEDDCVSWNTPIGEAAEIGRPLAYEVRLGLDGQVAPVVWAGLNVASVYHELDAETGEPTGVEVDVRPCNPYAATVDSSGNVWSTCLSDEIHRFRGDDPADAEIVPMVGSSYAIAVDWEDNLWVTGNGIMRYRPADGAWDSIATNTATSGIAIDAQGIAWSYGADGALVRVETEEPGLPFEVVQTGRGGRGISIDGNGIVWAVNWAWGGGSDGDVTLIDPANYQDTSVVCCEYLSSSYAYTDMIARSLINGLPPSGVWEVVIPGCEGHETTWKRLDFQVQEIAGTAVSFSVRAADELGDLEASPWLEAAVVPRDVPMIDLDAIAGPGALLGLRVFLQSADRHARPVLERVAIHRSCGP